MHKRFCFVIFAFAVFLVAYTAQAQAPDFIWAKRAGGRNFDAGRAVATTPDYERFSYVIGTFADSAYFGTIPLLSRGDLDIFMARYDTLGNALWVKQIGGPGRDEGTGLVWNHYNGTLLVTGTFANQVNFNGQVLTSRGGGDIFIADYTVFGVLLWAISAGGTGEDDARSIALDRQGNIFVAGSFQGSAVFGADTLTATGIRDFFLAKYDGAGKYLWAVAGAATGEDWANRVAVDDNGNCFVTGAFAGVINLGGRTMASLGYLDAFIAKYDPNGHVLWAQQTLASRAGIGSGITVDKSGNSIVVGSFFDHAAIGPTDTLYSISPDSGDIFVAKFDSTGKALWSRQAGGFGHDEGRVVIATPEDDIVVGGSFGDEATFGNVRVRSAGGADLFIARYDAAGGLLWVKTAGGAAGEYLADMVQDSFGEYSLTGSFAGMTRFDSTKLSSAGYDDIFVAKLERSPSPVDEIMLAVAEVEARPGDTVLVALHVKFPFDSKATAAEISLGGYQAGLDLITVVMDSSLIGNAKWTFHFTETDSLLRIAASGARDIGGEGILLRLKLAVRDTVAGFIPIILQSAIFNWRQIGVKLISGGVKVIYRPAYGDVDFNGRVQAFDASLILKYLVKLVHLNPQQRLNADVSLDNTVSALDAALILQYVVGLIDSLPHPSTGAKYLASAKIDMGDTTIRASQTMEVPIHLAHGKNVLSFEGLITFDPAHLQFLSINTQDLLPNFTVETKVEGGAIRIAGAGKLPEEQAGAFLKLKFIASEQFTDEQTTVRFERVRWNEGPVLKNVAAAELKNMTVGISEPQSAMPKQFSLAQNYPNPIIPGAKFGSRGNASTTIQFALPKSAEVKISIYNLAGQTVTVLLHRQMEPGYHTVHWDAANAGAGIYLVKMQAGEFTGTRKLLVLK